MPTASSLVSTLPELIVHPHIDHCIEKRNYRLRPSLHIQFQLFFLQSHQFRHHSCRLANQFRQKHYDIIIGGSTLQFDGSNAYNVFQLIFPNGQVYSHNLHSLKIAIIPKEIRSICSKPLLVTSA